MKHTVENIFYQAQESHKVNYFIKAEKLYKDVLEIDKNHFNSLSFLGILYGQQDKYQDAILYLKKAYELNKKNAVICNNLAEAYRRNGEINNAIKYLTKAIDNNPRFEQAFFNLGGILSEKKDYKKAIDNYYKVIHINPKNTKAYNNIGNLLFIKEDYLEAINYYNTSLKIDNNQLENYNRIGLSFALLNKVEQSIHYYQESINLNPKFMEAYNNFGSLMNKIGNYQEAINIYLTALKIDPINLDSLKGLANVKVNQFLIGEALDIYDKITHIAPNLTESFYIMGSLFLKVGDYEKAIETFEKAINIDPSFTPAFQSIAILLEKQGKIEEALLYYEKILKLKPEDQSLAFHVETITPTIFKSSEEINFYRSKIENVIEKYSKKGININLDECSNFTIQSFYMMPYHGRFDRELREKYVKLFQNNFDQYHYENKNLISNPSNSSSNEKKHIGFLISAGHESIFIKSVLGILNNLKKGQYKYTIISEKSRCEKIIKPDILNNEIEYLDLPTNIKDAIKVVKEAKFDLLNFWEVGTDSFNFFLPYFKLAPIQSLSWGWPLTSGNKAIDYYISSDHLESEGSEKHYVEELFKIKYLPTYYYTPKSKYDFKKRDFFELSDENNIYFCSQTLLKVHPDFDYAIKKILERDKFGVVLFLKDKQESISNLLIERLKNTCSDVFLRIKFVERMSFDDYLNLVALSDVMIDTFYYTGANTTYDAFSVGVPVVTLPDKYHRSRHTYAAYQEMEMQDCIAKDVDDYIEKVIELGTNKKYHQEISKKIVEKCDVVFENIGVVHEYERFFEYALSKTKS
ncbi:MAG: tetratricopeptide repeat protein [Candidatus Sericytochromatia bacterium]|nr:tetratricopeptide repeat protein [Candidatus Sericytochromatia bacterium]